MSLRKLRATRDSAGVSPSWAALTSVNNAAWIAYLTVARYRTALGVAMQINGSVALVTGANRELGLAYAGNWSAGAPPRSSTSTCSTRRTRPAPAPRRPAA